MIKSWTMEARIVTIEKYVYQYKSWKAYENE